MLFTALSFVFPSSFTLASDGGTTSLAYESQINQHPGAILSVIDTEPQTIHLLDHTDQTGYIETITGIATTDVEEEELEKAMADLLHKDVVAGSATTTFVADENGAQNAAAENILRDEKASDVPRISVDATKGVFASIKEFAHLVPGYRPTHHNMVMTAIRYMVSGSAAFTSLLITGLPPTAAGFVAFAGMAPMSAMIQYFVPIMPWHRSGVSLRAERVFWLGIETSFALSGLSAQAFMKHFYPQAHLAQGSALAIALNISSNVLMAFYSQRQYDYGIGRYFKEKFVKLRIGSVSTQYPAELHKIEFNRDVISLLSSAGSVFCFTAQSIHSHFAYGFFALYGLSGFTYRFWPEVKSFFTTRYEQLCSALMTLL